MSSGLYLTILKMDFSPTIINVDILKYSLQDLEYGPNRSLYMGSMSLGIQGS